MKKNRSSRAQDSNVGAESRRTAGTATAERAGPSRRIGPTPCGAGPPRRTLAHLSADLVVPSLRRANVVLDGPGRWPSTAQSAPGRGTGLESSRQGQPGHSTCRRARKCPTSVAYRTCWIDPHGNEESLCTRPSCRRGPRDACRVRNGGLAGWRQPDRRSRRSPQPSRRDIVAPVHGINHPRRNHRSWTAVSILSAAERSS